MSVVVRDAGTPQKSAETTVRVNVLRNSHTPAFIRSQYAANIDESLPIGSVVIGVSATDGDAEDQRQVCDMKTFNGGPFSFCLNSFPLTL